MCLKLIFWRQMKSVIGLLGRNSKEVIHEALLPDFQGHTPACPNFLPGSVTPCPLRGRPLRNDARLPYSSWQPASLPRWPLCSTVLPGLSADSFLILLEKTTFSFSLLSFLSLLTGTYCL